VTDNNCHFDEKGFYRLVLAVVALAIEDAQENDSQAVWWLLTVGQFWLDATGFVYHEDDLKKAIQNKTNSGLTNSGLTK
jgi:hypothetical protein